MLSMFKRQRPLPSYKNSHCENDFYLHESKKWFSSSKVSIRRFQQDEFWNNKKLHMVEPSYMTVKPISMTNDHISCSNLLQFFTNSVSQSWSASTIHGVLEISMQDGLFPKDVFRKQQYRALTAIQQCTYIGLKYSAKFSYLIKTKTKRSFKARIAYYPNSVATFNFNALMISLSSDAHPLPGVISRKHL